MKSIQSERRWCVWRWELDRNGRNTKVPHIPGETDTHAESDEPDTWRSFDEAQRALASGNFEGAALFFSGKLCGIDIDGTSHTPGGEHNTRESEILAMFADTYAERSPSGNGVHILFYADPARLPCVQVDGKRKLDAAYMCKKKFENGDVELYCGGLTNRYFTWTGDIIDGRDTIVDKTDTVLEFLRTYMKRERAPRASKARKSSADTAVTDALNADTDAVIQRAAHSTLPEAIDVTDNVYAMLESPSIAGEIERAYAERQRKIDRFIEKRLTLAMNAKNGEKFCALYNTGNFEKVGYGSQSEADQALCAMLAFWLNNDRRLVDRAFRKSALMRPKWDEVHNGVDTYGVMTINKAIDTADEPYRDTGEGLKYKPPYYTDGGNAEVFSAMMSKRARWCAALGWIVWDGKQWKVGDHLAGRLMQTFARAQIDEAKEFYISTKVIDDNGKESVDPEAKRYLKHATYTYGKVGMKRGLDVASERMVVELDELDSDPFVLNTPSGIVNLHTGEIKPHDPEAMCTKMTAVAPSDEGAEMWRDFLKLVTDGNAEIESYLKRVAGMSTIGRVLDETLQVAYNMSGHNGKSTFYNALQRVLGEYSGSIDVNVLTLDKRNKGASLATLRGKRLVICGELERGQWLSTQALKQLTSTDRITSERKYYDPEDFDPSHHICMFTNHLPRVAARDGATWRRLTIIPFTAQMPTGDADIKNYSIVLASKAGGAILKWMIEGAVEYLGNGCHLHPPAAVLAATAEYRGQDDWAAQFFAACCVKVKSDVRTPMREIYQAYKDYAEQGGENYIHTARELREEFERMGYQTVNVKNVVKWKGIDLNPDIFGSRA